VPQTITRRVVWFQGLRSLPFKLNSITLHNLKIVSSNLVLDDDVITVGLPTEETVILIPYNNCGNPQNQTIRAQKTYKVVKGYRIDFTKTIVSSEKIHGDLSFSSLKAGAECTITTTLQNTQSISETKEDTETIDIPFNIAPNSIADLKITIQRMEARRRFEGTILVEGDMILLYLFGKPGHYAKHRVGQSLASVLNENQRTLTINGFYSNINYQLMPIQSSSKPCP
jgi:hypothetical protein